MSSFIFKYIQKGSKVDIKGLFSGNTSFWQSHLWAEILIKTNQAEVIIAENRDSLLIERRKIWGKYTGLYILGVDSSLVTEDFVTSLRSEISTKNDLFLQIEPLVEDIKHGALNNQGGKAPFRRFIEPVTALLDLTIPEEELLATFAEKGRYNIRLAQKRGVTTRWVGTNEACSTKGSEKTYIEAFFDLLDETTQRDGFAHNSLTYYKNFVETLESSDAGGLLIAEKDGILHAAGVFAYWGNTAIYYYGASSSDKEIRRDMATYLLQWDAIRAGIERGCKIYDFLGISEDGKGKLAGVTEFKLRFNPEKKHWASERVIVFKPFLLFLLQCMSKVRKIFR